MTIQEKSTADGKDYAQNVLNANPIKKHTLNGSFVCFTAGGRGAHLNVINDEGAVISDINKFNKYCTDMLGVGDTLTESSTLAEVETDFLAWYNALEFYDVQAQEEETTLT